MMMIRELLLLLLVDSRLMALLLLMHYSFYHLILRSNEVDVNWDLSGIMNLTLLVA
jgi:hypothetical protein